MNKTTKAVGDRLPCGMVSLKMFQIPKSKALIIAYLNLRSRLPNFTFNQTDISNQTDIGKTVVRQYMKELENEGVLNRKGKGHSFYKLNRQRMDELYYTVSESDLIESDSDTGLSESDTDVSESDTDVSESDAIHSSKPNSRKSDSSDLHSSELDSKQTSVPKPSPVIEEFLSKSPKEQAEWLDAVDANRTMRGDLKAGKDVKWTNEFADHFANM